MPKYNGTIYDSVGSSGPIRGEKVMTGGVKAELLGYIWPGEDKVLALVELSTGEEMAIELSLIKQIETNTEKMKRVYGDHEAWVKQWDRGYDWGNKDVIGNRIRRFTSKYVPDPVQSLLEIACGYGRATKVLKPHCRQLFAIDLNQNCVDFCKADPELSLGHFEVTDGVSIPFGTQKFDLIFSIDSLVHVTSDVFKKYGQQIKARLSPEGIAIIQHAHAGVQGFGDRGNTTKEEAVCYANEIGMRVIWQFDEWKLPSGKFNDTTTVFVHDSNQSWK